MVGALCTAHPLIRTQREEGTKLHRQKKELNVAFPFLFSSVRSARRVCPGGLATLLCSLKEHHRRKVGYQMFAISLWHMCHLQAQTLLLSYLWQQSPSPSVGNWWVPGCLHTHVHL